MRGWAIGAAVAVVGVGGAVAWWLTRPESEAAKTPAQTAGATVAAGALGAMDAAESLREPYQCARWEPTPDAGPGDRDEITAFGRKFARAGATLIADGGDKTLVVGFVADARGADEATLANLAAVRAEFEKRRVELVVSLGGMGRDRDEIAAALDVLVRDARWPVVALPGGREALPAHREAVAQVADRGRGVIFDGTQVRILRMDGASIGTLPGIAEPSQLLAGNDGCSHRVEHLVSFARAFAELPQPRVLASYAPPRQAGETGSDLAAGGIHIGEAAAAEAVAAAEPAVVVHGLVDEAADDDGSGERVARARPLVLGAGFVDSNPLWLPNGRVVGGSAVVVTVGKTRTTWRRIGLPVGVD